MQFNSFTKPIKAAVIGASGGIGSAFVNHLSNAENVEHIYAFSRSVSRFDGPKIQSFTIDITDESSVEACALQLKEQGEIDVILVSSGVLHDGDLQPEKALRELSAESFQRVLGVNTIGPAMVAKHFLPLLPRDRKGVFAALSARVSSISDNGLGGWTAYRASKAALNMVIKNAAIEYGRRYKQALIVGLHPGTVDTALSKPFQGNVPEGKLFAVEYSAGEMLKVIDGLEPSQSGKIFAYDGQEIIP